jgi:hypothetical protein
VTIASPASMVCGCVPVQRRRTVRLTGAIAALALSSVARPAEWSVGVEAHGDLDHRENPRLVSDGGETIDGAGLEFDVALERATENSQLTLAPRVRSARYGASEFDTDEQYLALRYSRSAERYSWQVGADLARDTTLTSELLDTGLIDSRKRHQLDAFAGSFTCSLSARDQLGAQLNYQRNSYPDAGLTSLADYDYAAIVLTYARLLSERVTIGSQLNGGRLTVPATDLVSHDYGARLTLASRLSPAWRLALSAGVDRTVADARDDTGTVYSVELARSGELTDWRLTAGLSVVPSGSGVLVHRTDYAFSFSRRLSAHLGASFDMRHVDNEDLQIGLVRENRQYQRAGTALLWQLAEHWSLSLTAAYTRQAFGGGPFATHGFDGGVRISWSMPRRPVAP